MKKLFFLLFLGLFVLSQAQQPVEGNIRNQRDGLPLPDVLLTLEPSGATTRSDQDGNFSFPSAPQQFTLKAVKSGFRTTSAAYRLPLAGPLQVLLTENFRDIEEVTLSTGYQKLPKERSTGAFSYLGKELLERQSSPNIIDRIADLAASVTIDKGSSTEPKLMVRGLSTISGPRAPLIVLDDFPYEGNILDINPNSIESVTVLKDAAAASIWGARAANGVIVLTSKRGRKSGLELNFSTTTMLSSKPDLMKIQAMSSADFIEVERELFTRGFYNADINSASHQVLSPAVDLLRRHREGQLSTAALESELDRLKSIDSRQQFLKYMYQPAENHQYFLSMTGGTDKNSWLSSVGYDDNTTALGAGLRRWSARLHNTWKPLKNLAITSGVTYANNRTESGRPGYGEVEMRTGAAVPYLELADAAGNAVISPRTYSQRYKESMASARLLDWNYYPLTNWMHDTGRGKLQDITWLTGFTYSLLKGLEADLKYQYQRIDDSQVSHHAPESYLTRSYINSFTQLSTAGVPTLIIPKGAIEDRTETLTEIHNLRGQLNYSRTWGQHQISALAGADGRRAAAQASSHRLYGLNEHNLTTAAIDYVNTYPILPTGSYQNIERGESLIGTATNFVSYFGNVAYTYARRYTLSGSVRRDASNLFGLKTNDQWNPFWSLGAAWEISAENFYALAGLPYLKLRASYGFNGNIDPAMVAVSTIAYDYNSSTYTGTGMARIDNYYNPNLRWETSGMLNLGLDFSARNSRLAGSIDFFKKDSKDLFGPELLDYTTGVGYMLTNVASMRSYGIDASLRALLVDRAVSWRSTVNLSTFRDKITEYYLTNKPGAAFVSNSGGVPISGIVGRPVYAVFGYRWAGLDPQTGDPRGYLNGEISKDYAKLTGTETTIDDLQYFGSALPTIYGSMTHTFNWKNLSLDLAVSYKLGYWFRRSALNYSNLYNSWNGHSEYAQRWQKPGDEQFTDVPSETFLPNATRDNFYNGSAALIEKGDHIRWKYITLTYKMLPNTLLKELNLFVNVTDLGILWRANKNGLDPDYHLGRNPLAPPSVFSLGLRTKF